MVKVSIRSTAKLDIDDPNLKKCTQGQAVWWYGPITKNQTATSIPMVIVFFRPVDQDGNVDMNRISSYEVALTHLGLLRIGSIWKGGTSNSRLAFEKKRFKLSYTEDNWRVISPYDVVHNDGDDNPIPPEDYPLRYKYDSNRLLEFFLSNGKNLLIPCIEFFTRYYGRSSEVRRVLATYPWDDAQRRLYTDFTEPVEEGSWPVRLAMRMHNSDGPFIAHIIHDKYTQRAAKSIYAQIEAAFTTNHPYAFIEVFPWFQGDAEIYVEGLSINDDETFLGLRIIGGSDPTGRPIQLDRENTNIVNEYDTTKTKRNNKNHTPDWPSRSQPGEVELTDDDEPGYGTQSAVIEDDKFEILGKPRSIIYVKRAQPHRNMSKKKEKNKEPIFSTGERHGSKSEVGQATTHADITMESHGVLRDMWNAAIYLKNNHPETIQSVHWYTFDKYSDDAEPKLVTLAQYHNRYNKKSNPVPSNWLYHNVERKSLRGVLVIRFITSGREFFLLEVMRRTVVRKDDKGNEKLKEEAFQGLLLIPNTSSSPKSWLEPLLYEIVKAKRIGDSVAEASPGEAYLFKHSHSKSNIMPSESSLKNALKKAGVIFDR